MASIPYVPADLSEPAALVAAIRARRGGTLLNLDRMLLHSPPYAQGWNTFLGAVRTQLTVPEKLRELAICAVGRLNRADYEVVQHGPLFLAAGGNDAQLAALADCRRAAADAGLFDPTERAVLALTVAMTETVDVPATVLAHARTALGDDQQLVEMVGVIAAYNMVSRFLVALGVEPE